MKAWSALGFTLISGSAWAVQIPQPPNPTEPRICEVKYDPNDVVRVVATIGENVTIKFGKDETVVPDGLGVSDGVPQHFRRTAPSPSNLLYFKAGVKMPAQPVAVRTSKPDGNGGLEFKDYQIEWSAEEPPEPPSVNVAVAGDTTPVPKPPPPTCYLVRYTYPAEVKAAANAKAVAAWRKAQADKAEIALHQAAVIQKLNLKYVVQGDSGIAPDHIWDDGSSIQMHFPGRIPVLLQPGSQGPDSDAQLTNVTILDNGVVQIRGGTLPLIRLRDGENRVACLINKGYHQIPANTPITGTVSSEVDRLLKTDK